MEQNSIMSIVREAVEAIKMAIHRTRYNIMRHANKEALSLYYAVGGYISHQASIAKWGDKVIDSISAQLQQEMPGLRGFSKGNIKKMRKFFEEWESVFGSLPTNQFCLGNSEDESSIFIGSLSTSQLDDSMVHDFLTVQFTHHYTLLTHTTSIQERLYYIHRIATEFWSVEKLQYNLAEQLYQREGGMPNNFKETLLDKTHAEKALQAFRRNYKLEFMQIDDPDEWDEKRVEVEIVSNIKKFIMALGNDFSFMGNQYRLIVDEQEYFIDLLFFNRRLRSMVAIELKWTDFKPEYVGKMNFYLSVLDDEVRLPDENPSIGIILCRGQKQKTVEYALRDTNKPMGVATYRAANELPIEYGNALKELEQLKELL